MKINSKSRELSPLETYQMTKSPEIITARNLADGEIIKVMAWCQYTDTNSKGEEIELLSIKDENDRVYVAQSSTFLTSFEEIQDIRRELNIPLEHPFEIKKITGTAKSGREYINCVLVSM